MRILLCFFFMVGSSRIGQIPSDDTLSECESSSSMSRARRRDARDSEGCRMAHLPGLWTEVPRHMAHAGGGRGGASSEIGIAQVQRGQQHSTASVAPVLSSERTTVGERAWKMVSPAPSSIKKEAEARALAAACRTSRFFPIGKVIPGEEPDFRIEAEHGTLGIELAEALPPPRNESFHSPLAEVSLQREVVRLAEEDYYREPGAMPVKVTVYFWDVERGRQKKRTMVRGLVEFVRAHCGEATPVATFQRRDRLPDGFGVVSIAATLGPWYSGESVSMTVAGIRRQLAARIAAKNKLLPRYRANLPNSPIWLLLYSGAGVSRGVEMAHGIGNW
jgi:hypothetical protein